MTRSKSLYEARWQLPPLLVGAVLLVLAFAIAWILLSGRSGRQEPEAQALTQAAFEEETGVHISLLGVVGGGGFVNLRVKVLDAGKAARLFHDPEISLSLIVEDGDVTLLPPGDMEYDADFEVGRAYNVLFANAKNVIKPGSPVTVVIGNFRLAHVIAQ